MDPRWLAGVQTSDQGQNVGNDYESSRIAWCSDATLDVTRLQRPPRLLEHGSGNPHPRSGSFLTSTYPEPSNVLTHQALVGTCFSITRTLEPSCAGSQHGCFPRFQAAHISKESLDGSAESYTVNLVNQETSQRFKASRPNLKICQPR